MPDGLSGATPLASTGPASYGTRVHPIAAIVLAAGRSTRMRSKLPKPLHPICGIPMAEHVVRACRSAGAGRIVVIVGHEADAVRAGIGDSVEYALQERQLGTGDAIRSAQTLLEGWRGSILIVAGDAPLLKAESLRSLLEHHHATGAGASMLTAVLEDATGYGRVIRAPDGSVAGIVEEKDATPEQKLLREWNPSIYAFESAVLWPCLSDLRPNNAQGEYYLTDVIGLLASAGHKIDAIRADSSLDVTGVNTRVELADATDRLRRRILNRLMLSGVTITDPATTYVDVDVEVGQDTVLEPNTFLIGAAKIGADCVIGPGARVQDTVVGTRTRIVCSQVVGSEIGDDVAIGPFANIRARSRVASHVKIGDFVELKNATIASGVSAAHLSYLGDVEIGENTNIGAGTITCNFDGFRKHKTVIGKGAFVGTHSTLIAPVSVGDHAFIAAASAVTEDVPSNALLVARSRPTIKEQWAAQYRERNRRDSGGA